MSTLSYAQPTGALFYPNQIHAASFAEHHPTVHVQPWPWYSIASSTLARPQPESTSFPILNPPFHRDDVGLTRGPWPQLPANYIGSYYMSEFSPASSLGLQPSSYVPSHTYNTGIMPLGLDPISPAPNQSITIVPASHFMHASLSSRKQQDQLNSEVPLVARSPAGETPSSVQNSLDHGEADVSNANAVALRHLGKPLPLIRKLKRARAQDRAAADIAALVAASLPSDAQVALPRAPPSLQALSVAAAVAASSSSAKIATVPCTPTGPSNSTGAAPQRYVDPADSVTPLQSKSPLEDIKGTAAPLAVRWHPQLDAQKQQLPSPDLPKCASRIRERGGHKGTGAYCCPHCQRRFAHASM